MGYLDAAVLASRLPVRVRATPVVTDDPWPFCTGTIISVRHDIPRKKEVGYFNLDNARAHYIDLRTRLMAAALQAYRVAEDDRGNLVDQVV